RRFGEHLDPAAAGTYDAMIARPEDALALTILLDQFPRNIFRGSPQSFAYDAKALSVARQSLDLGHDGAVAPFQRTFFYLPFEHSEEMADQDRSVALFEALGDDNGLDYAVRHRDIVRQFGRFPHRNAVLGRKSTPEEVEFLKQPGSSFGDKAADEAEGS
ncbi:MAG: DUF924 family protein, partial [Pseudomonadota bacterium]